MNHRERVSGSASLAHTSVKKKKGFENRELVGIGSLRPRGLA